MVEITIRFGNKRSFDRNCRMHGQFFNHKIASFTKWNWKKSKFCMVVKSNLLYNFVKNQACFQTYPRISDFNHFYETGLKYSDTGSKYYETGVQLLLAISLHYMNHMGHTFFFYHIFLGFFYHIFEFFQTLIILVLSYFWSCIFFIIFFFIIFWKF